jgi:hypothetical protein
VIGEARITQNDKCVLVHVQGEPLSPQEIRSTLLIAVKKALESQLCIIIHREVPVKQRASIVNFYYYAKSISESKFRNRLALVFPEEMHHDNLDFFVTTSKNRGINLRLFSKMENATTWICGESK